MKTLCIETSTDTGSIAVLQDDEIVIEKSFQGGRGRDAFLFTFLQRVLEQSGTIDQVLVGVGPGGYSGLRVGISVALGLKIGRHLPAMGICSALGYAASDYLVVIDGRGSWIFAEVKGERLIVPPVLLDTPELLQRLSTEVPIYCAKPLPGEFVSIPDSPRADILAQRHAHGLAGSPLPLNPLYLKPPHITLSKRPMEWTGRS